MRLSALELFGIVFPKMKRKQSQGFVLWFTGLSGSGKTTIANRLFDFFKANHLHCEKLDGDVMRRTICGDLGFSREDRNKNIERAAFIAELLSRNGVIVLASFITPYRQQRLNLRKRVERYIEIFVNAPLDVCEKRDVKGLYKKVKEKKIGNFTGISDPYDIPQSPDIELRADQLSVDECVKKIIEFLKEKQLLQLRSEGALSADAIGQSRISF